MEAEDSSQMPEPFYLAARRQIPEDSNKKIIPVVQSGHL
jgi:hypothetical protein